MLNLFLAAVPLLTACAAVSKPKPYTPQYIVMVLYGGKFRAYPVADSGFKEKELDITKVVGSMCLSPDDWAAREKYILDLEAFAEGK